MIANDNLLKAWNVQERCMLTEQLAFNTSKLITLFSIAFSLPIPINAGQLLDPDPGHFLDGTTRKTH